jgi:hypothetical protein
MAPRRVRCGAIDASEVLQCGSANLLDEKLDPIIDSRPKTSFPSRLPWSSPMWVLLLLPFVGLLWVPFYNFQDPALFGFPFFYWYQLAWVPITSLLIWIVYRSRTPDDETR